MIWAAAAMMFPAVLADAAVSDIRRLRIPNRDSLMLAAAFLVFWGMSAGGSAEFLLHLAAGAVVFVAGALLFVLRVWGGGDAKLLAAVGLWVGFADLPRLLMVMALAGGALALAVIVLRRLPGAGVEPATTWWRRLAAGRHVPYGLAIAAGAVDWWATSVRPLLAAYLAS